MKSFIFPLLAGLALACAQTKAQRPQFTEQVKQEFSLPNRTGTLVIYNINGFIQVEGTGGDQASLTVDKRIRAEDEATLETGKRELKLQFEQKGDTIFAYIAEPFDSRPNRNNNRTNHPRIEYDFTLDFTVRVPRQWNLNVSTVNRGNVSVKDVTGALRVRNVNGAIHLTNAWGTTDAHTINGNVEANYLANPPEKSSYYTLNGDIKVSYPASLSADLQFKTFQGAFYTDFDDTAVLPAQVTKNEEKRGDKTVYKLNKTTAIRVGRGGPPIRFETFNGNVYIKKQS